MIQFTENEKKALIIIFRDIENDFNANNLSKKLCITRIGAMKLLKKLEKKEVLKSKIIGKSSIYKINLEDDYIQDMIAFLLSDEANNFKRWKNEFKEVFYDGMIVILFGSTLVNYSKANDIDLMIIGNKSESASINKTIRDKQKILPKKIHLINMSEKEFLENLEKKQKAIVDIVKNAIILYGQAKYVRLIKNVKKN